VRYAEHVRSVDFPENGGCLSSCWSTVPTWDGGVYPGNFGSGLNPPAGFLTGVWQLNPAAIAAYVANNVSTGPKRVYWPGEMRVQEKDTAGYVMADFGGDRWAANVGARIVSSGEDSTVNVSGGTNPTTTSDFGAYTPTLYTNQYYDFLPSGNIKFDITKDLVTRFAVAKTMARPDYSALGGAVNLTDLTLTGNGGNPNLRPIRSTNYDASIEWYFAPQSLLALGVFYMDLTSYVDFGTTTGNYYDQLLNKVEPYSITAPFNVRGKDRGVEFSYEQPIWRGFGFTGNYTYANGKASDGAPLVGASKNTYNVGGYYEDKWLSARVSYTYRSSFLVGLDRSFAEYEAAIGSLDTSINVNVTDHFKINFDALNLTNEVLKYYATNTDQPRAFYTNGRQYYAGVTYKF
jgi:iron complex outermembrane receptor protein